MCMSEKKPMICSWWVQWKCSVCLIFSNLSYCQIIFSKVYLICFHHISLFSDRFIWCTLSLTQQVSGYIEWPPVTDLVPHAQGLWHRAGVANSGVPRSGAWGPSIRGSLNQGVPQSGPGAPSIRGSESKSGIPSTSATPCARVRGILGTVQLAVWLHRETLW
jgi:hypothetical protein